MHARAHTHPQTTRSYAPANPRGMRGRLGQPGLRPGLLSGEAAEREVAAYLLDGGFAGVPATSTPA